MKDWPMTVELIEPGVHERCIRAFVVAGRWPDFLPVDFSYWELDAIDDWRRKRRRRVGGLCYSPSELVEPIALIGPTRLVPGLENLWLSRGPIFRALVATDLTPSDRRRRRPSTARPAAIAQGVVFFNGHHNEASQRIIWNFSITVRAAVSQVLYAATEERA